MKPTVPFEFEPRADDFEDHHLVYENIAGGQSITWPVVDVTLTVPESDWSLDFEEIEKANSGRVKFHGLMGFSIGPYHEILVGELQEHICFKMGQFEVSFGAATPLMAYLFDGVHREKYFGLWESIATARILGASADEFEVIFINAAIRYNEIFGVLPRPFSMDESLLFDEESERKEPPVSVQPPPIRDIDPIRFMYYGLSQSDDVAACIYFYRVLEYYSFLTNKQQMSKLRYDSSVSEDDFSKQILLLVTRDEKGSLLKLVNALADDSALTYAVSSGLIKNTNAALLGEAIYSFRNSIVHGKNSYGYALQSAPVLVETSELVHWRGLLRQLAARAVQNYGNRLF